MESALPAEKRSLGALAKVTVRRLIYARGRPQTASERENRIAVSVWLAGKCKTTATERDCRCERLADRDVGATEGGKRLQTTEEP